MTTTVQQPRTFGCPCCESTVGTTIRRTTASEAAVHYVRPWADKPRHEALLEHIRGLWGGDWCDIIRCAACGARTASPFIAGDEHFYGLAFGHTARYPGDKWEFQKALRSLVADNGRIPENLRVLEFGAGSGAFLNQLMDAGVNSAGLAAVEYSTLGRRSLSELGLGHVGAEQLSWSEAPESWRGGFDVVALFQVLEHLDDIESKLRFLRSCLRPDGCLLVAVPNEARIEFNENNGALLDQPPNHITCFSKRGLASLADRTGFTITSWSVQPVERLHDLAAVHFSRYLRRSQRPETLAARLVALSGTVRRITSLGYMAVTAPTALRFLPQLRDGMSVLAVLRATSQGTSIARD
jgi:SAM-dependent methyltransferase